MERETLKLDFGLSANRCLKRPDPRGREAIDSSGWLRFRSIPRWSKLN
jgi:hypothetical protein